MTAAHPETHSDAETPTSAPTSAVKGSDDTGVDLGEFDLDIRLFESGTSLDEVIRMTDDGCGATCQSACNSC